MRFAIYILALCSLLACKHSCVDDREFFDRPAYPNDPHMGVFITDTFCCDTNNTVTIKFHEYNEPVFSYEFDYEDKPFKTRRPGMFAGSMRCNSSGFYFYNNENPKPQLLFPFIDVGDNYYFVYRWSADTFKFTNYYKVKLDDKFYDPEYNDTIYKITRSPDTLYGRKHMFASDKIFFIGKHVGLVGLAMPIHNVDGYQPQDYDDEGLIMYGRLGNIYHQKYRYSLKHYKWE